MLTTIVNFILMLARLIVSFFEGLAVMFSVDLAVINVIGTVTAFLPAIVTYAVTITIVLLVIKFVLGR